MMPAQVDYALQPIPPSVSWTETEDDFADVLPLRYTNAGKKVYRRRLFDRDPHCIYCGKKLTPETATLEHALPQSKGGDHQPWNLFLACAPCNNERSSRDIPEWVAELRQKADRLETAYRRMLGELVEADEFPAGWPVALELPSEGARHED